MSVAHRLVLVDRGAHRRHRWLPACSCGWSGLPLRLKASARRAHRGHVGKPAGQRHDPGPRPITPQDRLPPALR